MSTDEQQQEPTKRKEFFTCRFILNLMVILGFMLNYALRVNLTIAIVAMVRHNHTTSENGISSAIVNPENGTEFEFSTTINPLAVPQSEEDEQERFNWSAYEQNIILGCFFWGYILTELPGGRLAELVGGRRVFGHSMLWASVLTLITPLAAMWHFNALVLVRVVLGFMLGASWPAILPLSSVWIPPMDRSKFIANMMASSLGAGLTMPICGFLISMLGWQSAFYFTGGIGLLWSICWFIVVYDSPATHPRISPEEKYEIETAIGTSTSKKRPSRVPWREILTSPPVWAIITTHGASVFCYFTVVNQLPTYMKHILHFNIKENGFASSFPYFGKYAMAVCASTLADSLMKSGKLNRTQTRKSFTAFAVMTPGILMILQVFFGQHRTFAVAIFTIALTLNGGVTAGYLSNGLDIAPNFSGTIFGMANTLSSFGGWASAFMVGVLTNEDQSSYARWQIVFMVLAGAYLLGSISFLIFGTGDLQPWNNPDEMNKEDQEAGIPLKEKEKNGTANGNAESITAS
uniref:CSON011174 protein n=1 Tax=Culicoides sonorensis TaxID=179676 RepID=A0A336K4M5_CULSO